jgi:hypothetical protein
MAPVTNARVLFNAIPKGTGFCVITHILLTSVGRLDFPVPGETTVYDTKQKIDLAGVPLNGGFLIMTLVLSVDPYMRDQMRSPETKSYSVCISKNHLLALFMAGIGSIYRG